MKKNLLFAAMILPFAAFSQNSRQILKVPQQAGMDQVVTIENSDKVSTTQGSQSSAPKSGQGTASNYKKALINYNFIQIGTTQYDLQTNASVGRRVLLHSDGTVSAVWTMATDNSPFSTRGSGYNHNNGTTWAPNPSGRIENVRLGWPSIGVLPSGSEYVIAHDAAAGGFRMATNGSKGTTTFTTSPAIANPANTRPIWGRAANNGNIIHLIANYADSASPSDPPTVFRNGIRNPMTYSRSLDGGVTWPINNSLLPDYDSTRIVNGGGDQYAIDVRDSIVAILFGGLADDVALWKSTDNGETWTKTIVDSFAYAPYNSKALIPSAEAARTNDGSMDVLIDHNGNVHAFWGLSFILDEDTTDNSFSFRPSTAAIMYWNETVDSVAVIATGVDRNNNQQFDIERGTFSGLSGGALPSGLNSVARNGNTSLLTQPSAGIDAAGNIYLTYSSPVEEDLSFDLVNFRDIHITYSKDGGKTWADPQNLTQKQASEENFGCIAKSVNGFVHLIFQSDEIPGTNLQNNDASANNHPEVTNKIMYAAIPTTEILANNIGLGPGVGISEVKKAAKIFNVGQNYPNPFKNETNVKIFLSAATDLNLTVSNILGQQVTNKNIGQFTAGNFDITIDGSSLKPGVYFYTISTGDYSITNKMIVE